jgi:hypothetical protein
MGATKRSGADENATVVNQATPAKRSLRRPPGANERERRPRHEPGVGRPASQPLGEQGGTDKGRPRPATAGPERPASE